MAQYSRALPCCTVVCVVAATALPARATVTVQDDTGKRISLAAPPKRIVSLLPSLTEMVCALGACERLVGVDRYSNFPPRVADLPVMGGGLDPSIEAIVALRPDVVLLAGSSRVADRLSALGLPVMALEPKSHADAQRAMLVLGALLGVSSAAKQWQAIDQALTATAQTLPPSVRNLRVYFEASQGPYGAAPASFIGETLTRLGVANVVPDGLGPFPKLNPEFIVRANPDVIMVGEVSGDALGQRPGWQHMQAIVGKRVCLFTQAQADMLVRPGPRMAQGAQLMAQCLLGSKP
ncbi:helical backbone metal receptor [Comamonadaceae bacterium M7527]|nr:helical backbone metal receptor [Comamonadaceae bacterium M7527]